MLTSARPLPAHREKRTQRERGTQPSWLCLAIRERGREGYKERQKKRLVFFTTLVPAVKL